MNKRNRVVIETPRLMLVRNDTQMLEALFESDEALATLLGIAVPAKWTEFREGFKWTHEKITKEGVRLEWWGYLAVLTNENTLVGNGGFKGEPKEGMVEIGYEVAPDYRCKGLATEMAKALINFAFGYDEVVRVQAHTLAVENESGSVLKRCGMQKVEELTDPEDGAVWRWEIDKQSAQAHRTKPTSV